MPSVSTASRRQRALSLPTTISCSRQSETTMSCLIITGSVVGPITCACDCKVELLCSSVEQARCLHRHVVEAQCCPDSSVLARLYSHLHNPSNLDESALLGRLGEVEVASPATSVEYTQIRIHGPSIYHRLRTRTRPATAWLLRSITGV